LLAETRLTPLPRSGEIATGFPLPFAGGWLVSREEGGVWQSSKKSCRDR